MLFFSSTVALESPLTQGNYRNNFNMLSNPHMVSWEKGRSHINFIPCLSKLFRITLRGTNVFITYPTSEKGKASTKKCRHVLFSFFGFLSDDPILYLWWFTVPETNIAPANWSFQKTTFRLGPGLFSGVKTLRLFSITLLVVLPCRSTPSSKVKVHPIWTPFDLRLEDLRRSRKVPSGGTLRVIPSPWWIEVFPRRKEFFPLTKRWKSIFCVFCLWNGML